MSALWSTVSGGYAHRCSHLAENTWTKQTTRSGCQVDWWVRRCVQTAIPTNYEPHCDQCVQTGREHSEDRLTGSSAGIRWLLSPPPNLESKSGANLPLSGSSTSTPWTPFPPCFPSIRPFSLPPFSLFLPFLMLCPPFPPRFHPLLLVAQWKIRRGEVLIYTLSKTSPSPIFH